jgi:hypothetical protein
MKRLNNRPFNILLTMIMCLLLFCVAHAEVVERIVAVVNDEVILLSEFNESLRQAKETGEAVKESEIIDRMINNLLLLEQAKKFSFERHDKALESMDQGEIIDNYIEKRIRALIYVPFRDIEAYYYNNIEKYDDRVLYDVRKDIEEYLLERTLEIKIQEHIDELREKARIRVQLD